MSCIKEVNSCFKFDVLTLPGLSRIEEYMSSFLMNPMSKSANKRFSPAAIATIERHLYSVLFSNCYAVLPTTDNVNTDNNVITFGYTPMPFINNPFSVRNIIDMNNIIRYKFNYLYLKYYSEVFAFKNQMEMLRISGMMGLLHLIIFTLMMTLITLTNIK